MAKSCVRLIQIPRSILAPAIMAMAVIGSYAIRGSMEDVWIMLFVGFCGFIMHFFAVPRAPMVLGLVLGTMAEGELSRSLSLVHGDVGAFLMQLITRPISLVILCLCILSLVQGIRQQMKKTSVQEI